MPTENRSSNTEQMVSVPRSELARLQENMDPHRGAVAWGIVCDLLAKPAAQHQGEPANFYRTVEGHLVRFVKVHNEGTNYETMEDESGVNRYTRRDFGRVTGTCHAYGDPRNTPPLYPRPNAGEVQRLLSELKDLRDSMTFRTSLIGRTIEERDTLRVQLAERDALLRNLRPAISMALNALDRDAAEGKAARGEMAAELRAALSASAEPSAPVAPCSHEWTDDGAFLLVCTACGVREDHDPKWRDMASAPRDGTMLRLLVEFEENSTEDDQRSATIGANNFDNDGEDLWQFAGWCWTHDHFTSGKGDPVGWLPMLEGPIITAAPVERDELVPAALMLRRAGFGSLADAVDEARAALERKP